MFADRSRSLAFVLSPPERRFVLLLAFVFFAAVSLFALDGTVKVQNNDSGVYIALAKSVSTGQGYRDIFLVGNPPHTQYPPVLPLLLAPLIYLLGYSFLAMKLMMVAIAVAILYALYLFCKEIADDSLASLVVLFSATSHGMLFYSQSILTEIPYLLFSVVALLSLQRAQPGRALVLASASLIALAYLTRLIGLTLLLATFLYLWLERGGKAKVRIRAAILVGSLAAVPALVWFFYAWSINGNLGFYWKVYSSSLEAFPSQSATETIIAALGRLRMTVQQYAVHAGRVILFYLPSAPWTGVSLLLALLTVWGFLWCAVRRRTILEYYAFFYICSLLPFPGSRRERYVFPLLPFIWYYFLVASRQLLSWLHEKATSCGPRYRYGIVVGAKIVLLLLLISNGATAVLMNPVYGGGKGYYRQLVFDEAGYVSMVHWAKAYTPPDGVFMWSRPALGFVLTERKAVRIPRRKAEVAFHIIRDQRVDYVVIDSLVRATQRYLRPVVETYPDQFRLVYKNDVSTLYRVIRPNSSS